MKFWDAVAASVKKLRSPEFIKRITEEDATMIKHIPQLTVINKLGFITTESQAGRKTTGKDYVIQERAYIIGFMLENVAKQFIQYIAMNTDKVAFVVPKCAVDTPTSLDIPLTVQSIGRDRIPRVHTHMSTSMPGEVQEMLRKEVKINASEKIVMVFCFDPIWNRVVSGKKGLFTEGAEALQY